MSETADAEAVTTLPWRRGVVGSLGLCLVAVALFSAAGPVARALGTLRAAVENDYLFVMLFGTVAVSLAAVALVVDHDSVRLRRLPAVERPMPAPEPGETLDDRVDRWHSVLPFVGREARSATRERLRTAAVRAVAAERGWSTERASAAVEDGSWTSDPVAERFLTSGGEPGAFGTGLAALGNGETPLRYRTRRTVDAIVACRTEA